MIGHKSFYSLLAGLCILATASVGWCQEIIWQSYLSDGINAMHHGQYAQAEKALRAAVKEAEQFGEKDARLALMLGTLGLVLQDQAKFTDAEPLFKQSCAIFQRNAGA